MRDRDRDNDFLRSIGIAPVDRLQIVYSGGAFDVIEDRPHSGPLFLIGVDTARAGAEYTVFMRRGLRK